MKTTKILLSTNGKANWSGTNSNAAVMIFKHDNSQLLCSISELHLLEKLPELLNEKQMRKVINDQLGLFTVSDNLLNDFILKNK